MVDTAHNTELTDRWLDDLARSEAELAAGRVVPVEPVMQRIRDSIARLEVKQTAAASRRKVMPRR